MKHINPLRLAFLLLALAIVLWVAGSFQGAGACSIIYRTEEVNGGSLSGFIEHGDEVRIAYGYYECVNPKRGDVAVYNDNASVIPVIKMVRGVEGDLFELALAEGGAKIMINGEVLLTSTGEPYRVSREAFDMLSLYIRDYHGVIPPDSVLLLGNLPAGSRDSTRFGLVGVDGLVGKVVKVIPRL